MTKLKSKIHFAFVKDTIHQLRNNSLLETGFAVIENISQYLSGRIERKRIERTFTSFLIPPRGMRVVVCCLGNDSPVEHGSIKRLSKILNCLAHYGDSFPGSRGNG